MIVFDRQPRFREAHDYLSSVLAPTPCVFSPGLSALAGGSVWLKLELAQPTRSFKVRGALNKVRAVAGEADRVVAASTGNHGLGVAYAASRHGLQSTVFAPTGANAAKLAAIRTWGAKVVEVGSYWEDALAAATEHAQRPGCELIHSFDDPDIVAGQGTIAHELAEQVPHADAVITAVGGGGLIAGVSTVLSDLLPMCEVWGAEPSVGPRLTRSLEMGEPVEVEPFTSIADGLAARSLSPLTWRLTSERVAGVSTIPEDRLLEAVTRVFQTDRLLVEPSAAATVAALVQDRPAIGETVVCVLSGSNIDVGIASRAVRASVEPSLEEN